jgi:class 3 adenylate cyclase
VSQEGVYFGRTVNVAARITDSARPGEVLVSTPWWRHPKRGASFREIGPVELKGVSGVVRSIPPIRRTAR